MLEMNIILLIDTFKFYWITHKNLCHV